MQPFFQTHTALKLSAALTLAVGLLLLPFTTGWWPVLLVVVSPVWGVVFGRVHGRLQGRSRWAETVIGVLVNGALTMLVGAVLLIVGLGGYWLFAADEIAAMMADIDVESNPIGWLLLGTLVVFGPLAIGMVLVGQVLVVAVLFSIIYPGLRPD